jgi:hypothetical protein
MGPYANVLLGPHDDGGVSVVKHNTVVVGGRISRLFLEPGNIHPAMFGSVAGDGDVTAPGVRSSGVRVISGNYEVTINDTVVLADSSSGQTLTVTLPDPRHGTVYPRLLGYCVTIKKINPGGGDVVIRPSQMSLVSPSIDGDANITISARYAWLTVVWGPDDNQSLPATSFDQGNWHIVGERR